MILKMHICDPVPGNFFYFILLQVFPPSLHSSLAGLLALPETQRPCPYKGPLYFDWRPEILFPRCGYFPSLPKTRFWQYYFKKSLPLHYYFVTSSSCLFFKALFDYILIRVTVSSGYMEAPHKLYPLSLQLCLQSLEHDLILSRCLTNNWRSEIDAFTRHAGII